MKILYEIWRETPTVSYKMERILSVSRLNRDDIISLDKEKLERTAKYLDDIGTEDVKHHVKIRDSKPWHVGALE